MPFISKTAFLQYQQCIKLFWISANHHDQIPWMAGQMDKLRQQEGRVVESYARQIFPDGVQVDQNGSLHARIAQSREAVLRPIFNRQIFNAIVQAGDLLVELDILLPLEDGGYDLFEVKSSTAPKETHLSEIAFQKHVCQQAGIIINHAFLLTLNSRYIKNGDINPKQLFCSHDVTEGLAGIEIGHQIESAKQIVGKTKCPDIEIGAHCDNPRECPMKEICWKSVNAHPNNVFTLTRMKGDEKWALFQKGKVKNADIPADYKLMPRQRIQIRAEQNGKIHVNKKGIKEFFGGLVYPLYFLDFETLAPAISMLDGTSPYQQIPFQFSLHGLDNLTDDPWHYGWIWDGHYAAVWRELLTQLESWMGEKGSIIAYNAAFEKGVLRAAVRMRPEYAAWLDGVLDRFVDLLLPFRNFAIYHPGQHGSASLKAVLPAWTGESYGDLMIQDGEMAGWAFRRLLESDDEAEREGIREELGKYCGLDTLGMVLIMRELEALCGL